jgi:hypothetical protein
MSYHPLLNNVILDSVFKYLELLELRQLRVIHPIWTNLIDLLGTMKHQWFRTHLEIKRLKNRQIKDTNKFIICPIKGCTLSCFFQDGNLIVQITDIVKQNSYQRTIRYDNCYFYDFMKPIRQNVHIIPSVFCHDNLQHLLFCLTFQDIWIIIDFTHLNSIKHFKCNFVYDAYEFVVMRNFQRVYFNFTDYGRYLNMSELTFLKVGDLTYRTFFASYYPKFFENNDYNKIVHHYPHDNTRTQLEVYDTSKKIYQKIINIDSLSVRNVYGICKNYILVISNLYATFYNCSLDAQTKASPFANSFMFFRIYTFPSVARVITLSDYQVFILFKWSYWDNNCNQMMGYYVNLKEKSLIEFAHQDEFVSLQYVSSVIQLNHNVFMGVGLDTSKDKFVQIILDFNQKILHEFNDFDKLESVADQFRSFCSLDQ